MSQKGALDRIMEKYLKLAEEARGLKKGKGKRKTAEAAKEEAREKLKDDNVDEGKVALQYLGLLEELDKDARKNWVSTNPLLPAVYEAVYRWHWNATPGEMGLTFPMWYEIIKRYGAYLLNGFQTTVPPFNDPCFYPQRWYCPVLSWTFDNFALLEDSTMVQTQSTSIETVIHATHFKSFLEMTQSGDSVKFEGHLPGQYRSNEKLIWFAANPGEDLEGHGIFGGNDSLYGRVVLTIDMDELKDKLVDNGVAAVFKLGTRKYCREFCHTYLAARDSNPKVIDEKGQMNELTKLGALEHLPTQWEWRWKRNQSPKFDQVDIAVALQELELPLDAITSITLLPRKNHMTCVRKGRLTRCMLKADDEGRLADVKSRLDVLGKKGVKVVGL